jgi:hypothetical protein
MILWTPVLSEGLPDFGIQRGIVVGIHASASRFGEGLGFAPSTGFGGSVSFRPFPAVDLGVSITKSASQISYDAVGSTSTFPVSLTEGVAWARYTLWTPGGALSVQAEGGAGLMFISTGSHTISLGALGTRSLPSRHESRPTLLAAIPFQVHAGPLLVFELSPGAAWVFGPSALATHFSLSGGLGIAIR